jgi:hypothetical protein
MLAVIEAYHAAQPAASDADARHAAILIIAGAARAAPGWFWHGVGGAHHGVQTIEP